MRTSVALALVLLFAPAATGALVEGSLQPLVAPPAGLARGPSGYDPLADAGSRLMIHFRVETGLVDPVAAVLDADGHLAARVTLVGSELFAAPATGARNVASIGVVDAGWHRLDVVLDGATATFTVDQTSSGTLALAAPVAAGRIVPAGSFTEHALARNDAANAVADDVFTSFDPAHGWTAVGSSARFTLQPTVSSLGAYSRGRLVIENSLDPDGRAFLAVPVGHLGGTYVAEVAAKASAVNLPDASLLAGVAGTLEAPTVLWELRMVLDMDGGASPSAWRLLYVGPDGATEYLTGRLGPNDVVHARAVVDEGAGRIAVVVDEDPTAYVATPAGGVPASAWIAVGDMHGVGVREVPRGAMAVDDLVVVDV